MSFVFRLALSFSCALFFHEVNQNIRIWVPAHLEFRCAIAFLILVIKKAGYTAVCDSLELKFLQ